MQKVIIGNATLYCGDCREVLPGLEGARRQGRVGGSKPKVPDAQIRSAAKRIAHGEARKAVASELGISRQALYKRMKELREADEAKA